MAEYVKSYQYKSMNTVLSILILGSGGREHAIAWKIRQSRQAVRIFVAPGNAGTADIATNVPVDVTDFEQLKRFCIEEEIQMLVVGPEVPLVEGVADFFQMDPLLADIDVIGPGSRGAMLEGSKAFAKDFMLRHQIPTAAFLRVNKLNLEEGFLFLQKLKAPYVLKADGLAAGKGVLIIHDPEEARHELKAMLEGKFGKASDEVVIEEFLPGIEMSAFVLTDGSDFVMLPSAKDYKRIGENDSGPNTGGMGAVSPVVFADKVFMEKVKDRIIKPTILGLQQEQIAYKGFIFFGLMNVGGDPYVIEYNARLGDPETECILTRIKTDFVDLLRACAKGSLGSYKSETDDRFAVTVMLVAEGYPGTYKRGDKISGLETVNDCVVFHAGTASDISTGSPKTNGGRVLAVTALGDTLEEARATALSNAAKISYQGKYYRRDIGLDLLHFKPF